MQILVNKKSFLLAPVIFLIGVAILTFVWACMEPEALRAAFDADGHSFFETLTLPFYALIVPTVWLCCPFTGSKKRKILLCAAVSCVAAMAVVKETDLHLAAITALYPDVVKDFGGTPFKMRFLTRSMTNGHNPIPIPFGAKCLALAYFGLFFGVFAGLLAYYAMKLFKGFLKLHPVAWSICFLGGSGVMVQIFDRLPAWYRHSQGLAKDEVVTGAFGSFCTALEEGGEMMIAVFALLAILQAHAIYCRDEVPPEFASF